MGDVADWLSFVILQGNADMLASVNIGEFDRVKPWSNAARGAGERRVRVRIRAAQTRWRS